MLAVLNFLSHQGIVKYLGPEIPKSKVVSDTKMISVRTAESGIFEPLAKVGNVVEAGQPLAEIIDPYTGDILETLYAPLASRVFFIHNEPLTYANTAVIKLVLE